MVKKKKRGSLLLRVRKKLRSRKKKPASNIKKVRKVRKPAKRVIKKPSKAKEEAEVGFEEVVIKCPSCGREFRIVKSSGFSAEGMLCQRCAAGGGIGLEEEDDF